MTSAHQSKFGGTMRYANNVDDFGPAGLVLEFGHPALDEALPLAGRMILGVLG